MFFIYRMGGGGAARTMLNIINHLDRTKFKATLVTLDFTYSYEKYVRKDVEFIKLPVKRLRQAIKPLAKLIQKKQPDLLFSTVPNYNTIAILAKLLSRTKTKIIVREAAYLGGSTKENIKLKGYGILYRIADRVIALSDGVKENLVARYHLNEKQINVIYNPVDVTHIKEESEKDIAEQQLFNGSKKIIITAGRFVAEKDHLTLLRSFARIDPKLNVHLILLGEGELEDELKQEADNLHITDRVSFLGFKQNPYAYIKRADVFALTSTTEGFGHVLVEALALGIPVVSTRCNPGAEEILGDETYGMLADVGDVEHMAQNLERALTLSDEKKEAVITKGKKRAAQFAAHQIVKQYERTFLEVMDNSEQI